jgi:hypothetical protein
MFVGIDAVRPSAASVYALAVMTAPRMMRPSSVRRRERYVLQR